MLFKLQYLELAPLKIRTSYMMFQKKIPNLFNFYLNIKSQNIIVINYFFFFSLLILLWFFIQIFLHPDFSPSRFLLKLMLNILWILFLNKFYFKIYANVSNSTLKITKVSNFTIKFRWMLLFFIILKLITAFSVISVMLGPKRAFTPHSKIKLCWKEGN